MALPISSLVADWQCLARIRPSTASGTARVADANPNRLALGLSYRAARIITLTPITGTDQDYKIYLNGPADFWFFWQKHGPMVALAWQADGLTGLGDFMNVMEVTQTNTGVTPQEQR